MKKVIVLSMALMLLTACGTAKKVFNGGGSEQQAATPGQLPETVQDEFNKGIDAYQNEQYVNAQQHFANVTKINPNIPEAHLNLALALYRQGKTEEADRHFDQAQKLLSKEGMGGTGAGGGLGEGGGQHSTDEQG